jgi:orotate phosphoribosyltransferase
VVSAIPPAAVPSGEAIVRLLTDSGAVRFGEFTLASGEKSDVYIDVKRAWPDPDRLDTLAAALVARLGSVDRLAGMELGAVPLVVAVALRARLPYAVLRKAAKDHGTRQAYEGEIPPGSRVLLIEDACTTGGTTLRSIEIIRAAGGRVDRVLVVVDRESGARERLAAAGVEMDALVTLSQLLGARR